MTKNEIHCKPPQIKEKQAYGGTCLLVNKFVIEQIRFLSLR